MTLESITDIARWMLLSLGAAVIVWALLIRGRAKGKRRCPKCWYDMSATEGMLCPECGRAQKSERRFGKRRRSWRLAGVGLLVLVLAYAAGVTADVRRGGLVWAMPRWALVLLEPLGETPTAGEVNHFLRLYPRVNPPAGVAISKPSFLTACRLHLYYDHVLRDSLWRWEQRYLLAVNGDEVETSTVADPCMNILRLRSREWAPRKGNVIRKAIVERLRLAELDHTTATLVYEIHRNPRLNAVELPFTMTMNGATVQHMHRPIYPNSEYYLSYDADPMEYRTRSDAFEVSRAGRDRGEIRVEFEIPAWYTPADWRSLQSTMTIRLSDEEIAELRVASADAGPGSQPWRWVLEEELSDGDAEGESPE